VWEKGIEGKGGWEIVTVKKTKRLSPPRAGVRRKINQGVPVREKKVLKGKRGEKPFWLKNFFDADRKKGRGKGKDLHGASSPSAPFPEKGTPKNA